MSIEKYYNSTAITQREGYISGSDVKKALVNHLEEFACHIQPLEPSVNSAIPGSFGKSWIMFCPVLEFKEGDKVIVDDTDEYKVVGVETFTMSGNPHCEVVLRTFKE